MEPRARALSWGVEKALRVRVQVSAKPMVVRFFYWKSFRMAPPLFHSIWNNVVSNLPSMRISLFVEMSEKVVAPYGKLSERKPYNSNICLNSKHIFTICCPQQFPIVLASRATSWTAVRKSKVQGPMLSKMLALQSLMSIDLIISQSEPINTTQTGMIVISLFSD